MATPAELALQHTDLGPAELEHLQRLLGSWSVLADLSFSDLLLMVPVSDSHPDLIGDEPQLVVLGQIRPNNRPTLVEQDLVGQTVAETAWTLSAAALHTEDIVRGKIHHPVLGETVPVENIPVRLDGKVIAVLLRVSLAPLRGPTSLYERTYLEVFERLAAMVAESAFPFPDEDVGTEEAPRVGDGVVVVDAEGRVEFASPNAINAFHRMGVYSPPDGRRFTELGVEESADVIVLVHCIPLLSHGSVTGAMILLRDVTDVRRLDRLLLSKDAAIREVHHRVKNNLQTISSLLSLQARRVGDRAARVALHEAERRVRSIALVHEILSRDPSDQVPFAEVGERCGSRLSRLAARVSAAREDPDQAAAWADPDDRFPEPESEPGPGCEHEPGPGPGPQCGASLETCLPGDREYLSLRARQRTDLPGAGELRCSLRASAEWLGYGGSSAAADARPGRWLLSRRAVIEAWGNAGIGVRAILTSAELVTFLDTVLREPGVALAGLTPASAITAGKQLGASRRPARWQRGRVPDGFARTCLPALRAPARSVPVARGDPQARGGDVRR